MTVPIHSISIIAMIVTIFGSLLGITPAMAASTGSNAADRLERATEAYSLAIEHRAAGNEAIARAAFDEAAAIYAALVDEHPASADLRRNLALAHIHAGRLGHGIADLRRAQALAPHHKRISHRIDADLLAARGRVLTRIEGDPAPAPLGMLRPIARPLILWTGLAVMAIGWTLALLRVLVPRHAPGFLAAISIIVIGSLTAASAIAALWSIQWTTLDQGVIVVDEAIARTGPSAAGFPPAFDRPLSQGVELGITERRSGWAAVTLPDGREAWLPVDSIEYIFDASP